jgi:hypothetical protein
MSNTKKIFIVVFVVLFSALALTACGGNSEVNELRSQIELLQQELESIRQLGGIPGLPGSNGEDGADGINGKDGRDGRDGKDGADGRDGRDGIDGKDGSDGRDGVDGIDCTCKCVAPSGTVIHELGDTVDIFNNGILVFSLLYYERVSNSFVFTVTNHNVAGAQFNTLFSINRYNSSTNTLTIRSVGTTTIGIGETRNFSDLVSDADYVYVSFPGSIIPIVIFRL